MIKNPWFMAVVCGLSLSVLQGCSKQDVPVQTNQFSASDVPATYQQPVAQEDTTVRDAALGALAGAAVGYAAGRAAVPAKPAYGRSSTPIVVNKTVINKTIIRPYPKYRSPRLQPSVSTSRSYRSFSRR